MKGFEWPPELDGIKIDRQKVLGRIKDTDIWIEISLENLDELAPRISPPLYEVILAWVELLFHSK